MNAYESSLAVVEVRQQTAVQLTEALNYGELGNQVFIKSQCAFESLELPPIKESVKCEEFDNSAHKRDEKGRALYYDLLNSERNMFTTRDTIFGLLEGGELNAGV